MNDSNRSLVNAYQLDTLLNLYRSGMLPESEVLKRMAKRRFPLVELFHPGNVMKKGRQVLLHGTGWYIISDAGLRWLRSCQLITGQTRGEGRETPRIPEFDGGGGGIDGDPPG